MSEWISIDERLPDNQETVLVWCYDEPMLAWNANSGRWLKIQACQSYDRGHDSLLNHVTHWQALPAPPEIIG